MTAILFGSISTISDTSELQREAFNRAFEAHGLDWHWGREEYVEMLDKSGGQKRVADYARSLGETVDAGAIHRSKSEIFRNLLAESRLEPRAGVAETIRDAKSRGSGVALVTTTSPENVSALIAALPPSIEAGDFDLIVDSSSVAQPKPDKAAYSFALETLGERPDDSIAIEDNVEGVEAAVSAGLSCVAFPNGNTATHDFGRARRLVERLDLAELRGLIPAG